MVKKKLKWRELLLWRNSSDHELHITGTELNRLTDDNVLCMWCTVELLECPVFFTTSASLHPGCFSIYC